MTRVSDDTEPTIDEQMSTVGLDQTDESLVFDPVGVVEPDDERIVEEAEDAWWVRVAHRFPMDASARSLLLLRALKLPRDRDLLTRLRSEYGEAAEA